MTRPRQSLRLLAGLAGLAVALLAACTPSDPDAAAGPTAAAAPALAPDHAVALDAPRDVPGLHNLVEVLPGVWSGSMPEGDAGFDALAARGVRTLVSVDGARPDVAAAAARGIRTVHVPIEYGGIEPEARASIARAFAELPRPLYVHCHHGKHRGPAAVAWGLVANGEIDAVRGTEILRTCGTSERYAGLWAAIGAAAPLDVHDPAVASAPLPEVATVSDLVGGMARIDRAWDRLRLVRDAGWRAPDDHPDLVGAAEAGIIADVLRTLDQDAAARAGRPDDYHAWMREAFEAASAVERALLVERPAAADEAIARLAASCTACHRAYRD